MKSGRILLVNSDPKEVALIKASLESLGLHSSFHWAKDGRAALHVLMGSHGLSEKPNLIIASALLPDMSAFELFSIIRKYHSLIGLKFILLTDRAEYVNPQFDTITVDGYLHRPLKDKRKTKEKLARLFSPDDNLQIAITAVIATPTGTSILSVLKQKLTALPWLMPAAKTVAFAACAVTTAVVVSEGLNEDPQPSFNPAMNEVTTLGATLFESAATINADRPEAVIGEAPALTPATVENETPLFVSEIPLTEPDPEPIIEPDTVVYEKKFSIGVRGSSETK
jgi:CheY-like chemotaxis protein